MSAEFLKRVPVESLAREAAWFDGRQLNKFLWHRIAAGNGLNKVEREEARELVRRRIAQIRATSQQPTTPIPPTSPYTQAELRAAVREIEFEVRRKENIYMSGNCFPWGAEFGAPALWLLSQLAKPSCLLATQCQPSAALCFRCEWIFALYSEAGRQSLEGGMLELQRRLKLISV